MVLVNVVRASQHCAHVEDTVMKRTALVVYMAALVLLSGTLWPVPAAPQGTGGSPSLPSDAQIREMLAERVDVQRRNVGIIVGIVTPAGRRVVPYGRFRRDDSRPVTGQPEDP
jgi:hypothetical protein